jgi:hypothetical protein
MFTLTTRGAVAIAAGFLFAAVTTLGGIASPGWAVGAVRAAGAGGAAEVPDGLSVAISDGKKTVSGGDTLTYTVAVDNVDASVSMIGSIVVTIPTFSTITEKGGAATATANGSTSLTWPLDIKSGTKAKQTFSIHLGSVPKGVVRVSTLATVYAVDGTVPVIGTADSNRIAGRVDPSDAANSANSTRFPLGFEWLTPMVGVAIVALVAMIAAILAATLIARSARKKRAVLRRATHLGVKRSA